MEVVASRPLRQEAPRLVASRQKTRIVEIHRSDRKSYSDDFFRPIVDKILL